MPIYRYSADSPIDEIEIIKNDRGGYRAYLHASSHASAEQLASMQAGFSSLNWKSVPYNRHGKPVLELRGFKKIDEFNTFMASNGHISGTVTVEPTKYDKKSLGDKFNQLMLSFVGYAYNIGDTAYMTYAVSDFLDASKAQNKFKNDIPGWLKHHEKDHLGKAAEVAKNKGITEAEALSLVQGNVGKALAESKNAGYIGIASGIGYAAGGIVLSGYGSRDQSQNEIRSATEKMQRFLLKEGIRLPEDSSAHQVTRKEKKSFIKGMNDFLARYPSETLNFLYTFVGLGLATTSVIKANSLFKMGMKTHAWDEVKDIGLGLVTMTSALIGLVVKEKKPIKGEEKSSNPVEQVWNFIEEKPLRATGIGLMISTGFHAWSSFGKYRNGDAAIRKTLIGRIVFVAANVVAEVLLLFSSKGHGEGVQTDRSTDETVIANAADIVVRQNPAQQEALIERLAGYMSQPEVLGGKAEVFASKLREQVVNYKTNPWANTPSTAPDIKVDVAKEAPAVENRPTHQVTSALVHATVMPDQQLQAAH